MKKKAEQQIALATENLARARRNFDESQHAFSVYPSPKNYVGLTQAAMKVIFFDEGLSETLGIWQEETRWQP